MDIQADIRLTGKQLARIIRDFNFDQYLKNESYYKGKNPKILADGRERSELKKNPNNVIPLPFARRTIIDLQGYAYKPGNVKYEFETENESTEKIDYILDGNDETTVSAEIFRDACIKGEGAELIWYNELSDPKIQFAKIPREQVIFRYSDTVKENELEYSIRFYKTIEIQSDGSDVIKHIANIYWPDRVDTYEYSEKGDVKINQKNPGQAFDTLSGFMDYKYIKSEPHVFGFVPLYPYNINDDRLGVYEASIAIIDELDGIGSDSMANAIDQFNDTILTLSKKASPEMASLLKELRLIDDLGNEGHFAEFLQRKLDIQSTMETFKIFERLYFELTGIPNLSDEKFGNKSGVAILYSLVSFENLVTGIEIYFSRGLKYRLKLINSALIELGEISAVETAEIKWSRNLPFDVKGTAEVIEILSRSGILSKETLIKMLPDRIVGSVEDELDRQRAETQQMDDELDRRQMQLSRQLNDNNRSN